MGRAVLLPRSLRFEDQFAFFELHHQAAVVDDFAGDELTGERGFDLLDLKRRLLCPDFTSRQFEVVLGLGSRKKDDAVEVPEREQGQDWPRLH